MNQSLTAIVDAALADEHDFDDAWQRLGEAITNAPDDPALRRLRLRLAEAARELTTEIDDLRVLHRLQPDDLEVPLRWGLKQHRFASWLLPDDDDDDDEALDDGDGDGDGDGNSSCDSEQAFEVTVRVRETSPSREAQEHALCAEALDLLLRVAADPRADAALLQRLLQQWDEMVFGAAWQQLLVALRACAAHPAHLGLRAALARAWAAAADAPHDVELPEGQVPMGFAVDAFGSIIDANLAGRALGVLAEVLAADPADTGSLELSARLNTSLSRFADAARDHRNAAAAWRRRATGAALNDDERSDCLARADAAQQDARRCSAGRSALVDSQMESLNQAVQGLGRWRDRLGVERVDTDMERLRDSLGGDLETLGEQLGSAAATPDAEALAAMDRQAELIASKLGSALAWHRSEWVEHTAASLAAMGETIDRRLLAQAEVWSGAGLQHLGWCENPQLTRQLGGGHSRLLCGLWQQAGGEVLVIASVVGAFEVVDFETEFSDGLQITTSSGRGRNFLGGGPRVDALHIGRDLPPALQLALHQARVALRLAVQPELAPRPLRAHAAVADFAALQERQREAKMAHRLAVGLDDFEALSVPAEQPEHFAPRLQAAALAFVQRSQLAAKAGRP